MKITKVNTYFVRPRWGFVEIETDEGITGWGEAVLEGHAAAVLACGASGPVTVDDASVVAKSYPGFWQDFESLERVAP